MAALTCDICGGSLAMDASGDFAVCESCGMKHTKERVKAKAQEITGTVEVSNIANLESLMKRGNLALEDGKYGEAEGFFDKVLDINPEYAPAYVGKLRADISWENIFRGEKNNLFVSEIKKEEDLARYCEPLDNYPDYQKAIRFADDAYRARLEGYNNEIKKRIEELKKEYAFYMIVEDTDVHRENKLIPYQRVDPWGNMINESRYEFFFHTEIRGKCLIENPNETLFITVLRTGTEYEIYKSKGILGRDCYKTKVTPDSNYGISKGDIVVINYEMLRKKEQERIDEQRREEQERAKQHFEKLEQERKELERKKEQQEKWKSEGLCYYCGGKLSLFGKKCKSCGKEN